MESGDWQENLRIFLKLFLLSLGHIIRPRLYHIVTAKTKKMFIGEYQHNIDDKGRLAIPTKFRLDLANGAVVTRGLDNCLFLYGLKEWEKLADKLASLPISQSKSRAFSRLMLAGAMDVKLDSQGRIVLPDYLRKFCGMKKKVVITGLYNRLEIWDEEQWNKYQSQNEKSSKDIAEAMGELGV